METKANYSKLSTSIFEPYANIFEVKNRLSELQSLNLSLKQAYIVIS